MTSSEVPDGRNGERENENERTDAMQRAPGTDGTDHVPVPALPVPGTRLRARPPGQARPTVTETKTGDGNQPEVTNVTLCHRPGFAKMKL